MKYTFSALFIGIALLLFVSSCKKDADPEFVYEYEQLFTSGLDGDNQPVDELDTISLNDFDGDRLYCFTKWKNLEEKEYNYVSHLYDGQSNLLYSGSFDFTPSNATWNTWTYYTIDAATDKPGEWKFDASMNGQDAAVTGSITVTQ